MSEELDRLIARLREPNVKKLRPGWRVGRECPECGAAADRPKCLWEQGGACPRNDPEQYDPPPYDYVPNTLCVEAADALLAAAREAEELRSDNARLREELDGVIKELADAREEHRRHVHNLLARVTP